MKDINFIDGDIDITNNDFTLTSDSESLRKQLYVFLSIRSDSLYGETGEIDYLGDLGIDTINMFEVGTTDEWVNSHIRDRINSYYRQYIKEFVVFQTERVGREIKVYFEYKDIFNKTNIINI